MENLHIFDIQRSKVQSSVQFVGRFEVKFQRTNLGSKGSNFGFLKVQKVQGSVFQVRYKSS